MPSTSKRQRKPKPPTPTPCDEWVSYDDGAETWLFDKTFLTSRWSCIYGCGCQGVLTEPAPEQQEGCCSYGAHFADGADRKKVKASAARLRADQWQFRSAARRAGGAFARNDDGAWTTILVDDACVFLNRPGFEGGTGCALHAAAVEAGERPMDWKPEVCWQLPLRLETTTDELGHVTHTLRRWRRRDWGDGGGEFAWWCTESDDAFVGSTPAFVSLRDEIIGLVGEGPYEWLTRAFAAEPFPQAVPAPTRRAPRTA